MKQVDLKTNKVTDKEFEDDTDYGELIAQDARAQRDMLLRSTDSMALPDHPQHSQAVLDYRQALRDVPQQAGFPHNIIWPDKPQEA